MARVFVKAVWAFDTDREDELTFKEGDVMEIVNNDDENWWEVSKNLISS